MEHGAEIRGQRSGVKLISDLRLLTSVTDDFNDSYGLSLTVYRFLLATGYEM